MNSHECKYHVNWGIPIYFSSFHRIQWHVCLPTADINLLKVPSSWTQRHIVCWKSTDICEEHVASIFRVANKPSKKRTLSRWQEEYVVLFKVNHIFLSKCQFILNKLYGLTSQKTELFLTSTVGISNPKWKI